MSASDLSRAAFIVLASLLGAGAAGPAAAHEALPDPPTRVYPVGHRGTKKFAPENTIAAIDAAIARGAKVVEIDVRCTKDGHFVVMHDAKVERTTDGHGRVKDLTLAEVKRLDAGSWFGPEFAGERVPTLREALRALKGRAAVDIDFKGGPQDSGALLADILDEEGWREGPLVTIFARAWHYEKLRGAAPRYLVRPHFVNPGRAEKLAREDGVSVMGLRRAAFSFRNARAIRKAGLAIFANVMGRDDGARGFEDSLAAGAVFIQSDNLDALVQFLDARGVLATCVPARDFSCWTPTAPPLPRIADMTAALAP